MKNAYKLFSVLFFAVLIFGTTDIYGQCQGNEPKCKKGIAIVREDENGQHTTPTVAMSFPEFNGGINKMCLYIKKNMQYPSSLKSKNITGTTMVQFLVSEDGSISEVEVAKSSGYKEFDDEAVRIVKSFPNWKPAKQECEPISMKTQVPIEFK